MSEQKSIQLLPCPGCGSPAVLRSYRDVRCDNDACWWEISGYGCDSDADMAAQWNQRAASPAQGAHSLHEHDAVVIETQYGMRVRIVHTAIGELEIERLDGETLTAIPLTQSVILLVPLPFSARQLTQKENQGVAPHTGARDPL